MNRFFLFVVWLLGVASFAHSDVSGLRCKVESPLDSEIGSTVKNFLDVNHGSRVWHCIYDQDNSYYELSEIGRLDGLCFYLLYELELSESSGRLVRVGSAQKYLSVDRGVCPQYGDAKYVAVNDLTEFEFSGLFEFFEDVMESPERFDDVFRNVLSDGGAPDELRRNLRVYFFNSGSKPRISSMMSRGGFSVWHRYMVEVEDPIRNSEFYAISIDRWFWFFYRVTSLDRGIY